MWRSRGPTFVEPSWNSFAISFPVDVSFHDGKPVYHSKYNKFQRYFNGKFDFCGSPLQIHYFSISTSNYNLAQTHVIIIRKMHDVPWFLMKSSVSKTKILRIYLSPCNIHQSASHYIFIFLHSLSFIHSVISPQQICNIAPSHFYTIHADFPAQRVVMNLHEHEKFGDFAM